MNMIKRLNKWANAHTYYPLDLIRIGLGVFLVSKGLFFINNSVMLLELIKPMQNFLGEMIVIHYVAPAHILGGLLIIFGLLTRWALLAQIPILIGAVLINFVGEMNGANLAVAGVTLLVALFFVAYGSGKHSADYYFKMEK